MPPKKDKKSEEKANKAGKGEGNKDSKKKKVKVLPKGAGMGGTIGLAEKEVKKCIVPCVKSFTQPSACCPQEIRCPTVSACCPPACAVTFYATSPPSCCWQSNNM